MSSASELTEALRSAVAEVEDPELPVTIDQLGMLRSVELVEPAGDGPFAVVIRLRPTFLGCPARFLIEADVRERAARFGSLSSVDVVWDSGSEWRPGDVSATGRAALKEHGVVVDVPGVEPRCPYCDSPGLELLSERGVALCRRLLHCSNCGSSVDVMGAARGPGRGGSSPALRLLPLLET